MPSDCFFRGGDNHPDTEGYDGDLESFGKILSDRSLCLFVPKDRFKRMSGFYENY